MKPKQVNFIQRVKNHMDMKLSNGPVPFSLRNDLMENGFGSYSTNIILRGFKDVYLENINPNKKGRINGIWKIRSEAKDFSVNELSEKIDRHIQKKWFVRRENTSAKTNTKKTTRERMTPTRCKEIAKEIILKINTNKKGSERMIDWLLKNGYRHVASAMRRLNMIDCVGRRNARWTTIYNNSDFSDSKKWNVIGQKIYENYVENRNNNSAYNVNVKMDDLLDDKPFESISSSSRREKLFDAKEAGVKKVVIEGDEYCF